MSTTRLSLVALVLSALVLPVADLLAQASVATCDDACMQQVVEKFNAGKQLDRQGQYEAAAVQFAAVLDLYPQGITSQDAALRAARALVKAGRYTEAVPFFDSAIHIADLRAADSDRSKSVTLKITKRQALFLRPQAWELAGNRDAAARATRAAVDSIYGELVAETPSIDMHKRNAADLQYYALIAAKFFQQAGELDRAMLAYNYYIQVADVLATADTGSGAILGRDTDALRVAKFDALMGVAAVCSQQGCSIEASQAVARVQAELLGSADLVQANAGRTPSDGQPDQMAELAVGREEQATRFLYEALQAKEPAARLAGAEYVI